MGYFRLVNSDSGRCEIDLKFIHCLPPKQTRQVPIDDSSDAIEDPDDGQIMLLSS